MPSKNKRDDLLTDVGVPNLHRRSLHHLHDGVILHVHGTHLQRRLLAFTEHFRLVVESQLHERRFTINFHLNVGPQR